MYRVSLVNATQEIVLHGPGISAPLKGARQTVFETSLAGQRMMLEVFMEGLPGDLRACQDALSAMLRRAAEGLSLQITPHNGAQALEARVLEGQIELARAGSFDRARGSLALKLDLRCAPGWEAAEVELPLSQGGAAQTGGVAVMNHADADSGHVNYVDVAADVLPGDMPGALRLEMTNNSAANIGDVWVCLNAAGSPADFAHILEGESASGGSLVAQTGCSGGALRRVSAGASESTLLAWTLDQALLEPFTGRIFRPLARFAAVPAYADLWLWWQAQLNGTVLWESPRELLASAQAVQELPALRLPLDGVEVPHPLVLCLRGMGAAGSYSLDVDFVQLCPLDGWRRYRAAAALAPAWTLVDDAFTGRVYARSSAGQAYGYSAQGAPLRLPPGQAARLIFLHAGEIENGLVVRAFYRPRWKEV